jgi:CheY-like chemotaxis protein
MELPSAGFGASVIFGYNVDVQQNIVVVEDDPDISRLVQHHLEQGGFGVKAFATALGVIAESEHASGAVLARHHGARR